MPYADGDMSLGRLAACGLAAGALGTLAMDLVWFARYNRGGGSEGFASWESAASVKSWEDASAPARVGKLLYEWATARELPSSAAALTTNVMHWSYGVQWGVLLALSLGSFRSVRLWHAPLFGILVWLASYVILPIAGFYKPIWKYDLKTLWQDLSAHLVYGVASVGAFWRLCRS